MGLSRRQGGVRSAASLTGGGGWDRLVAEACRFSAGVLRYDAPPRTPMSASGMGIVEGAEVVEVEDEEEIGMGLGLAHKGAVGCVLSNSRFAFRRSLRVWRGGRGCASDPEERRRCRFLAGGAVSAGKGFRDDWGLSAGGGCEAELAYTVTWGAVRVAQTRPTAWGPAEAGKGVAGTVGTTGVTCRDTRARPALRGGAADGVWGVVELVSSMGPMRGRRATLPRG